VSLPIQCLSAAVVLAITLPWFLQFVNRRLGGVTGDCLGCIGFATQLIVLLAAATKIGL
jgi:cobalamin synthase